MKYRTLVQSSKRSRKLQVVHLDELAMHHPNNLEILGKPTPPHQSQTILATASKPYPFTWQKLGSSGKRKGRIYSKMNE